MYIILYTNIFSTEPLDVILIPQQDCVVTPSTHLGNVSGPSEFSEEGGDEGQIINFTTKDHPHVQLGHGLQIEPGTWFTL